MQDEITYKRLTETPVIRLVIALGIPTTISMLVTNIYNMVDTYFIGKIDNAASGAVGVVLGLMALIQAFGFMFGHGSGSIISRKLGAGDKETASKIASTGFFWALFIGIIIGVLGLIFIDPLMYFLGSTKTIHPYAKTYAACILVSAPFMATSFVLNNIIRFEGKAVFAMVGLVSGALINIFGDWFLMGGAVNLGILGAGISTAVSQIISFLILLYLFISGKTTSKISIKHISREFGDLFNIIKTGFPSFIRQGLTSISTIMLNSIAAKCGAALGNEDAAVAAMSIVNRICFFIFAVGLGVGQGFQPVCSYNYGAKKYDRVKKSFFATLFVGGICLSVFAVLGFILSPWLVGFFRNDQTVIEMGTFALRAQLISLFFLPLTICANMLFQGVGKNGFATILSMMRSGAIFIPVLLLFSHFFGLTGVMVSQAVADILSFAVSIPFVIAFLKELTVKEAEN